jgi:DNA-binding NarL/FixJ family response regulator
MDNPDIANERKTGASAPPWVSRVYIVDDHRFFTFALASLINAQADLVVCGVGHNEAEAMSGIIGLSPDIVVLDVRLNAGDGLNMAAAVRQFSKQIPILFVSSMQHPSFGKEAKWLAPCSFVEKTQDPVDIIRGIQQTLGKLKLFQSLHPTSPTTPKREI